MNARIRDRRPSASTDAGFTLVELLVSIALFSIVITVVGGVLISSFRADQTVRTVTTGTTDGQLALNVIDADVRNSSIVSVRPAPATDSQLVVARVTPRSGPQCVALYYNASQNEIRRTTSTSAISMPANDAATNGWPVIATGVVQLPNPAGGFVPVFLADNDRTVTVRFAADAGGSTGSVFTTTVTGRPPLANASPQCF